MYAVGEFLVFSASPPFSIILRMLKEGKKPPPLTRPPPPHPHGNTFMTDADVVAVGNDGTHSVLMVLVLLYLISTFIATS